MNIFEIERASIGSDATPTTIDLDQVAVVYPNGHWKRKIDELGVN
jgi:hypothetical protein